MAWWQEYTLYGSNYQPLKKRIWNMGLIGRVRRFCHKGVQFGIDNLGFTKDNPPQSWGSFSDRPEWLNFTFKDRSTVCYVVHTKIKQGDIYNFERDREVELFFKHLENRYK